MKDRFKISLFPYAGKILTTYHLLCVNLSLSPICTYSKLLLKHEKLPNILGDYKD
jgi:hypothetical protein